MTKAQLNAFFSHFDLSPDYSEESISRLKKQMLLELKSAKDDLLHVNGRVWSKNDILAFFSYPIDLSFDTDEFYKKYEWTKLIAHPEKIAYFNGLSGFTIVEEDFRKFRLQEAVTFEERFFNQIKKHFRKKNDLSVASMLFYLVAFRDEFQFEVKNTLRQMMYTRLSQAEADIDASTSYRKLDYINFMFANAYYAVLARIGENDAELIDLNLSVFVSGISRSPVSVALELAEKQSRLPLSPEAEQYISKLKIEIDEITKKAASRTKIRRIVFCVLFGLMLLVVWLKNEFSKEGEINHFDYPVSEQKMSTEDSVMTIMFPKRVLLKGDSISYIGSKDTVTVHQKNVPNSIKRKIRWR